MYRNCTAHFNAYSGHLELSKQTAFHEAGHATAIYLNNRKKQLPPVFFEILLNKADESNQQFSARVVDGLLIQDLPTAILNDLAELSQAERHSYQCAYEADVVNLLAGPIAEARYISIRDDEVININLINTRSLHHYGGYSDVERAYKHLQPFIADKEQREEKMLELFVEAYRFVEDRRNWACILNLAHYILECGKKRVSCEEVVTVVDRCVA
jgi:hypothetical protein